MRTISRNIIVLNAIDVSTIMISSPIMVTGLKIVDTPASREPIPTMMTPVITALIAPARFKPSTSSSLVIGVTRYPSCTPRALSSMYNIPPPIITDTNMASTSDPGNRYFMYSIYG